MQGNAGTISEFGAEIISVGLELLNERGGCAQPDVQLFQRIVIDEIELNVFIAPALTALGVGLAQQVEFRALVQVGGGWNRARFGLR